MYKYLLLSVALLASSLSLADNNVGYIKDTNYFYAKGVLYQIAGDKAYKVKNIDGELLTTNEWIPTKRDGYTDEYVREIKQLQKEKQRVAKYANDYIKITGVIDMKKHLTQSIFLGVKKKWKYAAVDSNGNAFYYTKRVYPDDVEHWASNANNTKAKYIGDGFDTTNWSNSLIKRDI